MDPDLHKLWQDSHPSIDWEATAPTRSLRSQTAPASESATLPQPGAVEADSGTGARARYTILEEVGRGGMGVVYRARQGALERPVAIKKLGSPGAAGAFLAEARITGRLEHPNIIPVYDLDLDDEPGLAMKLIRGRAWSEELAACRREGPDWPRERDRHIARLIPVCHAIAFAHEQHGIVHGDLKPDNVMIGDHGEVLVVDWGLALDLTAASSRPQPCGTPCSMAPEQARGEPWSPATDVYLLGGILHAILAGQPPHPGRSLLEVIQAAADGIVGPLPDDVEAELRAIAARALAAAPEERFQSAEQLRAALETFLEHRESHRLAASARDEAAALRQDPGPADQAYAAHAALIARFRQARELWRDNPIAAEGEREARAALAAVALSRGDLGLAEAQVAALPDGPKRAGLTARLAARRRELERDGRARARLRLTAFGAATASFLVLALSVFYINKARESEAAQKRRAQESAAAAEAARLLAEERLAAITRLSDSKLAGILAREGREDIWPRSRAQIPAAEAWLERARPFLERASAHKAALARVRAEALPYRAADRERDRARHPRAAEQTLVRSALARIDSGVKALGSGIAARDRGLVEGGLTALSWALERLGELPDEAIAQRPRPELRPLREALRASKLLGESARQARASARGQAALILESAAAVEERLGERGAPGLVKLKAALSAALDRGGRDRVTRAAALRRSLAGYARSRSIDLKTKFLMEAHRALGEDLDVFTAALRRSLGLPPDGDVNRAFARRPVTENLKSLAAGFAAAFEDLEDRLDAAFPAAVTAAEAWTEDSAALAFGELGGGALERTAALRSVLAARLGEIEAALDARLSWRFARAEQGAEHEFLSALVRDLEGLEQASVLVRGRIEAAADRYRRSVEGAAELWGEARAAIAEDPRFGGLTLEPQEGLLPLGADPSSGFWEFAVLGSGAAPPRAPGGRLVCDEGSGIVLVLLPGGAFVMGSDRSKGPGALRVDRQRLDGAQPSHRVSLAPFFLAKHELSRAQWRRTGLRDPTRSRGARRGRFPVTEVDYETARRGLLRLGLCLPTEAQWEYAAWAGSGERFPNGAAFDAVIGFANLRDIRYQNSVTESVTSSSFLEWLDDGWARTAPVDALEPNAFGLHGSIGNVSEWCSDPWASYKNPWRPGDGRRLAAEGPERVARGGSYLTAEDGCFPARRIRARSDARLPDLGLRAARPLDP